MLKLKKHICDAESKCRHYNVQYENTVDIYFEIC